MAFMISVLKKYDRKPVPENIDDVDEWILEQEEKNTLYINAFGSDGTVYEYWCCIALDLGLSIRT